MAAQLKQSFSQSEVAGFFWTARAWNKEEFKIMKLLYKIR